MAASPTKLSSNRIVEESHPPGYLFGRYSAAIDISLVSLVAIPVLYILNHSAAETAVSGEAHLLFTGVLVCGLIFGVSIPVLVRLKIHDPFVAWFSLFAFTAIIDLLLAFNIQGSIDLMTWYLKLGERYLQCSYGFAINLWDGTAHWTLYILMIHALWNRAEARFRFVFLYWAGSIIFSMIVFIPGAMVGNYSSTLTHSSFLNIPYICFPLWILRRTLQSSQVIPPSKKGSTFLNGFFAVGLVGIAAIFFFRFLVAGESEWDVATWYQPLEPILADPCKSFRVQAFVSLYYIAPLLLAVAYSMGCGTQYKTKLLLRDLIAFTVGGIAQTNFSLLVSAYHTMTGDQYRSTTNECLYVNLFVLGVSHLFLYYAWVHDVFEGFLPSFLHY